MAVVCDVSPLVLRQAGRAIILPLRGKGTAEDGLSKQKTEPYPHPACVPGAVSASLPLEEAGLPTWRSAFAQAQKHQRNDSASTLHPPFPMRRNTATCLLISDLGWFSFLGEVRQA
jgi:hypothetical protein